MRKILLTAAFALVAPICAHAIDGQIDIAPDGATPFVISAPGSYVLVKNVTMTANVDCIQITSPDVTLDLNGHTIVGTNLVATSDGIDIGATARVTIRNGTIRQFLGNGVRGVNSTGGIGADNAVVSNLVVTDCGSRGIILGGTVSATPGLGSHVSQVVARNNGLDGILVGGEAIVEDCIAIGNNRSGGAAGIRSFAAGTIVRFSVASDNSSSSTVPNAVTGIRVVARSTVESCTAEANDYAGAGAGQVNGISTGDFCRVTGNVTSHNQALTGTSAASGILTGSNCIVEGNIATGNRGAGTGSAFGISVGADSIVANNTASSNTGGNNATGILTGDHATVVGNLAILNRGGTPGGTRGTGIIVGNFCFVADNEISTNSSSASPGHGRGLSTGQNCVIRGNIIQENHGAGTGSAEGMLVGDGCRVEDNEIGLHISASGIARGIQASSACRVTNNVVVGMTGDSASLVVGIMGPSGTTIVGNTISGITNTGGGAAGISLGIDATVLDNDVRLITGSDSAKGIVTTTDSSIGNNRVVSIQVTSGGDAKGIEAGDRSAIRNNTATGCVGAGAGNAFGIDAGIMSEITGNVASSNSGGDSGSATGIDAGDNCLIQGNVCSGNLEGDGGNQQAVGINADNGCLIEGNVANANAAQGDDGAGVGIFADQRATVRNNSTASNTGAGAGFAYGIRVSNGSLVEGNHCSNNAGAALPAYGILVEGATGDTLVIRNFTRANSTSGIRLETDNNRTEQNRMADGIVSAVAGNSQGAGDFADFAF